MSDHLAIINHYFVFSVNTHAPTMDSAAHTFIWTLSWRASSGIVVSH